MTLNAGSILDYEFNTTPANDFANVTVANRLTINGGGINLYQEGTVTAFTGNGTYNLIGYSGTLGGSANNLSVLDPVFGKSYGFGSTGSRITLTIADKADSGSGLLAREQWLRMERHFRSFE